MLFQHFDRNLIHQLLFLYILSSHHLNLRDHPWRFRTDRYNWKLSAKVSLMLGNPFPLPFLSKLKDISIYFIQNVMKTACKSPSEKAIFLKVILNVLGRFVNFKIIKRQPVFPDYLSVSYSYAFIKTKKPAYGSILRDFRSFDHGSFELVFLDQICRA